MLYIRSPFLIPPSPVNSIVTNHSATLLSHQKRSYPSNNWTLNDRLRLKNDKLSKRQQLSCGIAFYSFCLCIIAGVIIILIYRFTDECPLATNRKQYFMICLRHGLFLAGISLSLLACSGVIFGACRYFRSQPHTFLNDNDYELHGGTNNGLSSMTTTSSHLNCNPASFTNGTSMKLSRQTQNRTDENLSFTTDTSSRRKIPPFNYDELPSEPDPIIISKSSNSKMIFFSSSPSTLSSPQSVFSTTTTLNTMVNSNKSRATSILEDTCPNPLPSYPTCICEVDVWKKSKDDRHFGTPLTNDLI